MSTEPDLSGLVAAHTMIDGARRQRDDMICKLYRQGVPVQRMASALGTSRRSVYNVLDERGVERRSYGVSEQDGDPCDCETAPWCEHFGGVQNSK